MTRNASLATTDVKICVDLYQHANNNTVCSKQHDISSMYTNFIYSYGENISK